MSEQKAKKVTEPLFELREYEAELFAPVERRVEVKPERVEIVSPLAKQEEAELLPDTSSMIEGVMQPMMMMLTLGMVMPVMQQAMVGVLQSTEVTVVVKPGSIVSVEVTNSVLAVEVSGGRVNVTLEHSTIMLPVDLQGSTIMVPIDVQGSTIMMPVDIQGQYMDIDVRITGQVGNLRIDIANVSYGTINVNVESGTVNVQTTSEVTLNIWTPSGKWTSVSQTLSSTAAVRGKTVYAGTTEPFFSLSGRGRLMMIGFRITGYSSTKFSAWDDVRIVIIRDGETNEILPFDIDLMNGELASIALDTGLNALDYTTDRRIAMPPMLSPHGGITYAIRDTSTGGKTYYIGGYLKLDVEFTSSLEIKAKNVNPNGIQADVNMAIIYGDYI